MFTRLNRYIVGQIVVYSLAMTGVAMLALLLERLLRLLSLTGNPDEVLGYLSQMMITLIPHYLGIAMPAAFFLGVVLTFGQMLRESELAALWSSGIGLHRLLLPVVGLAFLLAVLATVIVSHLQPLGRYSYRSIVHTLAHLSLGSAIRDGTLLQIGDLTFIVDETSFDGTELNRVFVHQEKSKGRSLVTTAERGRLQATEDGGSVLLLENGLRTEIAADGTRSRAISFSRFQWPIDRADQQRFRDRGKDERELTLPELWVSQTGPGSSIEPSEIKAEFHARLVAVASIVFLPLLAAALSLAGGKQGQIYSIAVGLLILVVYQKILKFGEAMVDTGTISPWVGLWLPFCGFALGSAWLAYANGFGVPHYRFGWLPAQADRVVAAARALWPWSRQPP